MQYSLRNLERFWLLKLVLLSGLSVTLSSTLKSKEVFGESFIADSGEYFLSPRSGDMAFLSIKSRKLPSNTPADLSGVNPLIGDGSVGDPLLLIFLNGVEVVNSSSTTLSDVANIFNGVVKSFSNFDKNLDPSSSSSELSCKALSCCNLRRFEPPFDFLELTFSSWYIFGFGRPGLLVLERFTFALFPLIPMYSLELAMSLELVRSLSIEEYVSIFWVSSQACLTILIGPFCITDPWETWLSNPSGGIGLAHDTCIEATAADTENISVKLYYKLSNKCHCHFQIGRIIRRFFLLLSHQNIYLGYLQESPVSNLRICFGDQQTKTTATCLNKGSSQKNFLLFFTKTYLEGTQCQF